MAHWIAGFDTSGRQGSICLGRGDEGSFEAVEVVPVTGGTFSAQLIPQLASLLGKHAVGKQELLGLAAASGPGSFTGLRVGLAAIKGLAEVLGKPIAVLSLLEAMAATSGLEGEVAVALDASRNEVFFGEFKVAGERAAVVREELLAYPAFVEAARQLRQPVLVAEEQIAEVLRQASLEPRIAAPAGSEVIARLGLRKILAGETVSPETLDANYIRRSDAEVLSLPRLQRQP